ncbi:MAG: hypothetical protein LH631_11345 [Alkalinema sp. CAN_BIN05]|nr:hypothetical protein [Alkalinema sp. CAN_BIN05]
MIDQEKQALFGQLAADLTRELVGPMDFVDRNLTHIEDYIYDLVALLKLYRDKTRTIPDLLEEIDAQDAMDTDFLMQDFPKLASSIHEAVQTIHRKIEMLSQGANVGI